MFVQPSFIPASITELDRAFCEQHGLKGLIFDLDDTLIPEFQQQFSPEVLRHLKQLTDDGILLGILSNNWSREYVDGVVGQLKSALVPVVVLSNGYKPLPNNYWRMVEYLDLACTEVLFVGDGMLTDALGARLAGMAWLPLRLPNKPFYKSGPLFWARELVVILVDALRALLFRSRSRVQFLKPNSGDDHPCQTILFIVNPRSGQCSFDDLKTMIESRAKDAGFHYRLHKADNINHLRRRFGQRIKDNAFDLVVAAGGDGTVREVIALLAEFNPSIPMGILPTGTGNLLAKSLAIPEDVESALALICENQIHRNPLSIMAINKGYGALIAGLGADAEIMGTTTSAVKKLTGPLAYILSGIRVFFFKKKAIFKIRLDDKTIVTRAYAVFIIQRNQFGRAFTAHLLNECTSDDGLDVCVIKADALADRIKCLKLLFDATYQQESQGFDGMDYYRVKAVDAKAYPKELAQVDGDLIKDHRLKVRVLKEYLTVISPTTIITDTANAARD
jgi:diacylglycerol kinase (ATP)